MEIVERIAQELSVRVQQVQAAADLLEEATVPFVARYRKEATGGLDDAQLRRLEERLKYLRQLEERREVILSSIREQGKLTAELEAAIQDAETQVRLEDLYLPYRPKRRTKAQIAREAGLEPLAMSLWKRPDLDPEIESARYLSPEDGIDEPKKALEGARQILMEQFSEDAELIGELRGYVWKQGVWKSAVAKGKEEEGRKFSDYFNYSEPLHLIPSHRALALLRGRREGILRLSILPDAGSDNVDGTELSQPEKHIAGRFEIQDLGRPADTWLVETVRWAWKVKILTRIETDLENQIREQAEEEAIRVFASNLRDLLLAAPAGARVTMGLDPGIRTGVKVCVVDQTGKLVETATIYPHQPRCQWDESIHTLAQIAKKHGVSLVSIGNGTASRETDKLVRDLLSRHPELNLSKLVVSEAGASVYSASELASKEFPDVDVSLRGAISIARRLQDPLAELVKIEPKSIGVGQYQHDVNQIHLERSLEGVVEDCVNAVGVDVNTASAPLLTRVSGLGPSLAANLVSFRNEKGSFRNRGELLAVPGLGPKTFEQAAGFLRILNGDNPLDSSAVHPEAYPVVERIVRQTRLSIDRLIGNRECLSKLSPADYVDSRFGEPTVKDILSELEKPGRDPRPEFETASFKEGVNEIEDLAVGMQLEGVVTNVTNFGAFIDVGVHQDGLVHISQLSNRFVKDPREVVKAGDVVKVRVLEVDLQRRRVALSMKPEAPPPQPKPRPAARPVEREARAKEDPGGFNRPFAALRDLQKRRQ